MVFLRGKTGGSQPTGGSNQISAPIGDHIQTGDYCVLWVMSSTTTATITVPSWLTQLSTIVSPTACNCIQYAGFLPAGVSSIDVTCNDTTKAWLISASFWGGVDPSDPYAFAQFSQSGAAAASYTATIQAIIASDDLNVGAGTPLNAVVADRGGSWATSGAATDFAGDGFGNVSRSTAASEATPRAAILGSAGSTAQRVKVFSVVDAPMASGGGPMRFGVYGRYVDASNYVAAYMEINSYAYVLIGGFYQRIAVDVQMVVEVATTAAGVQRFAQPANADLWFPIWNTVSPTAISVAPIHDLSITSDGVITYSVDSAVTVTVDTLKSVLGTGGTLAAGKQGIYDRNGSATTYARRYTQFSVSGAAKNNTCVLVLAGMVPNADTFSIRSTPNDPAAIDEQIGDALGSNIGRALGHRYFFMPQLEDVTVTLSDNLEVGSGSIDYLTIGSIVLNPLDQSPYGQTTRIPTHRSSPSSRTGWKFFLANSRTFEHITMMRAMNRNMSWILNRPGEASFDIRMDSDAAKNIEVAETCLIAYRDGEAKWSGPIWNITEDTAPDTVSVTAVGWLQLLEKRLLQIADERYARFGKSDAGVIAAHLMSLTNARDQLPFVLLDVIGTQLRKRSYQRYQSIGVEITALSDIESGFDIWIDPATREMVIWNRFEEDLSGAVSFGYRNGPLHNLENVKRTRSADRLVNGLHVVGKTPGVSPAQQIDYDSVARFGLFEEQVSLSETTDSTVAVAYAAGELVYRSTPLQIFSITPKQHDGNASVPRPLDDYHVGSIIKFSANRGSIQVSEQKARVFALGLGLDNEGRERVTNLSITVSS